MRSPRAFEDPDAIQLDRGTDAGLVWGQGIHVCLGAPLARLEMRVALEELLARSRRFALAGEAPRRTVYPSNGLSTLPLRFDRGSARHSRWGNRVLRAMYVVSELPANVDVRAGCGHYDAAS